MVKRFHKRATVKDAMEKSVKDCKPFEMPQEDSKLVNLYINPPCMPFYRVILAAGHKHKVSFGKIMRAVIPKVAEIVGLLDDEDLRPDTPGFKLTHAKVKKSVKTKKKK